jgi:hypothetical protein
LFELDGESVEVVLSALDAASVRRVLARYVALARADADELSDIAKVRRWARSNNFAVASRGRIGRHVLDAYNLANRASVVDLSGRRPREVVAIEVIEQLRLGGTRRRAGEVSSEIVIVDADGTEHPFHPDLLLDSGDPDDDLRHQRP